MKCVLTVVLLLTFVTCWQTGAMPFPDAHSKMNSSLQGVLGTLSCSACKVVVTFAQVAFTSNWTDERIVKEATELCVFLHKVDRRVCAGLVHMFKPEALTVFDRLVLSPQEVCGLAVGPECAHPYSPFNSWNVSFPPKPKPPVKPRVLPKPGSPRLRVLHLTDIHLDNWYKPGTNAVCQEPLCCRADDGPPVPGKQGAGYYGDYRNCDTPTWTLEGLFSHLSKQQFDYILWTGDLPAHNIWNQTRAAQTGILQQLTTLMDKYFPSKPVFPALGNHESSPVDSFPPEDITGSQSIHWLYNALADSWKPWLPSSALRSVRKGGYYTVSPFPGFRLISINTNACNNMNWWLYLNTTDPDGQLSWLIDTLQTAEDNKEKVHIIGHIPPGIDDCLKVWSHNYYNIIDRYESTISGQFFGHTHFDHLEVFYDTATLTRPTSVAYISPSVTPYSNLNMGYRIFTIDGNYTTSSWEVLDHETYILNLTAANTRRQPPVWQLEYTAKAAYGMKSLFPADWNQFISRLQKNSTLLQDYYRHYYKGNVAGPCDADCSQELVCALRSARSHSAATFCPQWSAGRKRHLPKLC
ncbi:sphingomyelin phosphodiesterase-like [Babylonia areolata]|uniref:sphingomyelin phosphodiesterase-like n=1 Tax=Babylonia areolata TaxID=304850 RepID=UPI003FD46C11